MYILCFHEHSRCLVSSPDDSNRTVAGIPGRKGQLRTDSPCSFGSSLRPSIKPISLYLRTSSGLEYLARRDDENLGGIFARGTVARIGRIGVGRMSLCSMSSHFELGLWVWLGTNDQWIALSTTEVRRKATVENDA